VEDEIQLDDLIWIFIYKEIKFVKTTRSGTLTYLGTNIWCICW